MATGMMESGDTDVDSMSQRNQRKRGGWCPFQGKSQHLLPWSRTLLCNLKKSYESRIQSMGTKLVETSLEQSATTKTSEKGDESIVKQKRNSFLI